MDKGTLWWRLVHLEPALVRGLITAVVLVLLSVGVAVSPAIPDALIGLFVAVAPVVQSLWIRQAVTANARVVVEAPDPVDRPRVVVAGEATTTASDSLILAAAKSEPRG